jgi:hypothetical protein
MTEKESAQRIISAGERATGNNQNPELLEQIENMTYPENDKDLNQLKTEWETNIKLLKNFISNSELSKDFNKSANLATEIINEIYGNIIGITSYTSDIDIL